MKVLILFRWIYKWVNIRSYLKHSNISNASPFYSDFTSLLEANGLIEYLKADTEIIYSQGDSTISYSKILNADVIVAKDDLSLEKMCFIADKRNIIPEILTNKMEVKIQPNFYLKETINDILLALKKIERFDIDYLGIKFIVEKKDTITNYFIENIDEKEQYRINLDNASSGTQTLIPLSVIIEYFSRHYDFNSRFNNIVLDYLSRNDSLKDFRTDLNIGDIKHRNIHVHIEEPELSLYPESQRSLINFIINRCFIEKHNDYNMTVMMATHSPYIINHLNLLIKAYNKDKFVNGAKLNYDDVSVYQVAEGEIYDLKAQNIKLINTNPLSDTINAIYDEYEKL
jgi:hypothetical protein